MSNRTDRSRRWATVAACALVTLLAVPVVAQRVEDVLEAEQQRTSEGQQAEGQIRALAEERRDLTQEYRAVLQEVEGLETYNQQLERQIAAQNRELDELDESIGRATIVNRQILPLMLEMIGALDQFVELDVPFLLEERRTRVERLEAIVDRADVSVAEKYRNVLDAYQIESEYGRTIEAYRTTLEIDGDPREVDMLRIGRIGLFYQTLDEDRRGAWDIREEQWVELGSGYIRPIREGLRIARQQVAPDLLMLPVNAPEEVSR